MSWRIQKSHASAVGYVSNGRTTLPFRCRAGDVEWPAGRVAGHALLPERTAREVRQLCASDRPTLGTTKRSRARLGLGITEVAQAGNYGEWIVSLPDETISTMWNWREGSIESPSGRKGVWRCFPRGNISYVRGPSITVPVLDAMERVCKMFIAPRRQVSLLGARKQRARR